MLPKRKDLRIRDIKNLLKFLQEVSQVQLGGKLGFFFFFLIWPHLMACGILVS